MLQQCTENGMHQYDIRDFGAVGDSRTLNTTTIQSAIDQCHTDGGGTVTIAQGSYVTGTIYLKSHVHLHLEAGATLLGSPDIADYTTDTHKQMYKAETHMDRCLIFARDATGIGIGGAGTIDGQGQQGNFPNAGDPGGNRPMLIRLLNCSNIRMRDITLVRPASWTSAWLYCSDIVVEGIRIHSRVNGNGDGLDFDGCTDVRVSNCSFDTSDDSICLQTSRPDRPCRDIVVTNCTFCSKWAGMRIGLLSLANFENVAVSNCVFRDIDDAGLKIQLCEGAEMKRMLFSDLVMENVPRPVFMTFGQQRACTDAPDGVAPMQAMGDMVFSNILVDATACGKDAAFIFTGLPGHPIEDLTLRNITMTAAGGGTTEDANAELAELDLAAIGNHWPEYTCFGTTVPAYGMYFRHVRSLAMSQIRLRTTAPDQRPDILLIDTAIIDE
jgi:polygalacturonase